MIPLKIEKLLDGWVVEQDRVEYKKGWNPSDTIHTICAYANDFNNSNGGYVIIGVAEKYGRPVLPPNGIEQDKLDIIQQEIIQYCNLIEPRYLPRTEIIEYQGQSVIYLWCPAGNHGPFKAPVDVYSKKREERRKEYWIKPLSVTTAAKGEELIELFGKYKSIPFDDRIEQRATMDDIRRAHLEDFLRGSGSALAPQINKRLIEDLLVALEVANETDIGLDIRNIGLLMFCDYPQKFIPYAQVELIHFHSRLAEVGDFTEKIFTGPIQEQIRAALGYIKLMILEEKVVKISGQAEALRFWNYPYDALEEALVNAVFHKSYLLREPVEIRLYVDKIKIINYPGPDKSINMEKFRKGEAVSRKYRNRRIGEFLKELDLSEHRSTGITKILNALGRNGSPLPEFETDEDGRSYLETTIYIHERFEFIEEQISEQVSEQVSEEVKTVLNELMVSDKSKVELLNALSLSNSYGNYKRHILVLINNGFVEMTQPDKHTSRTQRYKITEKGRILLLQNRLNIS